MPLYSTIFIDENTTLYLWKISESIDELNLDISIPTHHKKRFSLLKTELQKKTFFAQRQLLKNAGFRENDLQYEDSGKPFLSKGKFISFSHSFEFVALVVSDKAVGVDIEKVRQKLEKVVPKFIGVENFFIQDKNRLEYLAIIWAAKESIYKTHNHKGIDAVKEMMIDSFCIADKSITAHTTRNNKVTNYRAFFGFVEDFVWVVSIENFV